MISFLRAGFPRATLIATMIVALACLGCADRRPPEAVEVTPVAQSNESAAEQVGWRLVGVGACTSSGCHGGGKPNQIVGSEYNIWVAEDPHVVACRKSREALANNPYRPLYHMSAPDKLIHDPNGLCRG
jgi:hypothetical protein